MPLDATNFVAIPDDDQHAPAALLPALPVQEIFTPLRTQEDEDAIRVLRRALQLIQRGWTRKAYARFFFIPLPIETWFATRYCAKGAINRAAYELGVSTFRADDMLGEMCNGNIIDYNDRHHTKKDVVFAFQCAITANT